MFKEHIASRVIGSENEFGFIKKGFSLDDKLPNREIPGLKHVDQYYENGSRFYLDCGLPEYATPECLGLKKLLPYEIAGERHAHAAYKHDIDELHKRTITSNFKKTTGAHESYSTPILLWRSDKEKNVQSLAVHFATRTAFTGAGLVTENTYKLAQKMQDIKVLAGGDTTGEKQALVNMREEDHTTRNSGIHRLHVTCGDANVSPWAILMKFGTTSHVLRLLENNIDLSDLYIYEPHKAAKVVASGVDGFLKPLRMLNNKFMTALDVQEELAVRSFKLSQYKQLPDEELAVLMDWHEIIDALRHFGKTGEARKIMDQTDWYAKLSLLNKCEKNKGDYSFLKKQGFDLFYDRVPDGIGFLLRKKGAFAMYMPDEAEIEDAMVSPPAGRAKLRGALIKTIFDNRDRYPFYKDLFKVEWDKVRRIDYNSVFEKGVRMELRDYSDEAIEKIVVNFMSK